MAKPEDSVPARRENIATKRRVFVDDAPIVDKAPEQKSWPEYAAACKLIKAKAMDLQKRLESMVKEWAEFEAATLQAYKKMPISDAMFSDSPLSPMRMSSAFRQNMAKLGWKWAAGLAWGPESVRKFYDIVDEACTWGERIIHDKERAEKIEKATRDIEKAKDDIGAIV